MDEILAGPKLKQGYIFKDELKALKTKDVIYVSDLLRIIMNLNGEDNPTNNNAAGKDFDTIIAVSDLSVSNYINNIEVNSGVRNCLKLSQPDRYIPKLSLLKSKIKVYQDGRLVEYMPEVVLRIYEELDASTLEITPSNTELPGAPEGEKIKTGPYYSVQNDFPAFYGIKNGELPEQTTPLRKAQANQLKAYLLSFDQLLGNFHTTINNLTTLFSTDPQQIEGSFYKALYDIPGIDRLLLEWASGQHSGQEWESYTADQLNDYQRNIQKDKEYSLKQRNLILDHMLARFGENMDNYSALMFATSLKGISNQKQRKKKRIEVLQRLARDKAKVLQDYILISRNRALGFDYSKTEEGAPFVWGHHNRSGLTRRIAGMMGLEPYKGEFLCQSPNLQLDYLEVISLSPSEKQVAIKNSSGQVLISSMSTFTPISEPAIQEFIQELIKLGAEQSNYRVEYTGSNSVSAYLRDENGSDLAKTSDFPNTTNLMKLLNELTSLCLEMQVLGQSRGEGICLVEHILLRASKSKYPRIKWPVSFR